MVGLVLCQHSNSGRCGGDADGGGDIADRLNMNRLSFGSDREAGSNSQNNYHPDKQCFHYFLPFSFSLETLTK